MYMRKKKKRGEREKLSRQSVTIKGEKMFVEIHGYYTHEMGKKKEIQYIEKLGRKKKNICIEE